MKKLSVLIISLLALALVFNACSKKGADKLVGKWKQDRIPEMEKMGIILDVTYEFTKDNKMILNVNMTHKIGGKDSVMQQAPLTAPYVIKQDDGTNMELEATHPTNPDEKGLFKIKFESDKVITFTDPSNQPAKLTKM